LRKELTGTGVRLTNILPGFVWTEGLQATLQWMQTDERSKENWRKFGLGEPQELLQQADKMLKPEDIANAVWGAVDKPGNVYINDLLIRDGIQ